MDAIKKLTILNAEEKIAEDFEVTHGFMNDDKILFKLKQFEENPKELIKELKIIASELTDLDNLEKYYNILEFIDAKFHMENVFRIEFSKEIKEVSHDILQNIYEDEESNLDYNVVMKALEIVKKFEENNNVKYVWESF